MSHFYISAAHKSSGKTSISLGLCAAYKEKGLIVQPFKKGPDYIDPLWLAEAAGKSCYNLDFYTMDDDEIDQIFARGMQAVDLGIIEGNKGLYDGLDLEGSNSNAAMAARLESPVVLVLDSQGMTRGIAPLILGYQAFADDISIRGVILNKVGGQRHESKLRAVIEHYTDVTVLGAVQHSDEMHISERHLGLVPSNEADSSATQIRTMGRMVADQINLDELITIAEAGAKTVEPAVHEITSGKDQEAVRIAYAKDSAFGFYYASDIEALESAGAVLLPFSPLADSALPEVDALLLGGGFPETHLEQLASNVQLADQIRLFIENGGPAYAECGGLMYLCRNLTWEGKQGKMLGIIPADVTMHERPQGRGYVQLEVTDEHPWATASTIAAHEFHYSGLENLAKDSSFAYKVKRGTGVDGINDGVCYKNLMASYAHQRHTKKNPWAQNFVDFVRRIKQSDEVK